MNTIKTHFNKLSQEQFMPLGFEKSGSLFLRKQNDVIHRFSFFKSSYGPLCTIEFDVFPLCMEKSYPLDGCVHRLEDIAFHDGYWQFDPHSAESIDLCAHKLLNSMQKFVIPYFENCTNCATFLTENTNLLLKMEENRLRFLKSQNVSDQADPIEKRFLHNDFRYYAALKVHDYHYAREYLEYNTDHAKGANKWKKAYLEILQKHLSLLNENNTEALDRIVFENEQENIKKIQALSKKIAIKWFHV